ncbi:hypothetical protein [uncultured Oceanisphaera sp.]|uniref:hypothetical protein n=1 Tax=uncultured Oceanisphaera sp. TaxID=353858 RepID=UPI0026241B1E|nr:hypothetical protein [uncultured Oceanisphaera sp.]
MKIKHSALLLAATLLTAPVLVNAASHGAEGAGRSAMMEDCERGDHRGMHGRDHHGKRGHGMMGGKMMNAERFEQHLSKRLEQLDTPELKAQFFATQRARLAASEQQQLMHRMMAESKAAGIEDADLKAATLEKIAADSKLKQLRLKQMQETLNKMK